MRQTVAFLLTLLAAVFAVPSRACIVTLDQVNEPNGAIFSGARGWQQEVRAGKAGRLEQIDLYLASPWPQAFVLDVYTTGGLHSSTDWILIEVQVEAPPYQGWYSINVAGPYFYLDVGQTFTIGVRGEIPADDCCNLLGTGPDGSGGYADGRLYSSFDEDHWFELPNEDLAFRTSVFVPEPASLVLVGSALALMAALARRTRNAPV